MSLAILLCIDGQASRAFMGMNPVTDRLRLSTFQQIARLLLAVSHKGRALL